MKSRFLTALLLIMTFFLHSQEMKLYAPFPSRIKAVTSGRDIAITWKDAADVEGGRYEIYRAGAALTADNLYLAEKVGETGAGTGTWTDRPPVGSDFYYAVFVRDNSQTYKICIPYRNVTTSPVSVQESDIEETKSTLISALSAEVFQDDVSLSCSSTLQDRNIILFRSTNPISNYDQLIKSVIVNEVKGSVSSFIDNPMPGLDYYYAAVDGPLYRSGNRNLLYDGNHTVKPVHVKFTHEITDDSRFIKSPMPLPLLKITSDLKSGEALEQNGEKTRRGNISEGTLASVRKLEDSKAIAYNPPPKATLAYNRNINSIITTCFAASKWADCADKLEPFTSSRYDSETRTQSHFYRGQAYFYSGDYDRALLELIMVEDVLYGETKPFFDAIYYLKRTS